MASNNECEIYFKQKKLQKRDSNKHDPSCISISMNDFI